LDGGCVRSNQDTLLTETREDGAAARVYVTGSVVEGDVDFVYGNATTVLEDSEIRSLDRGSPSNNGYVCAPNTAPGRYGLLFIACRFTSDAANESVYLGRPWNPSSDPDVEPSAVKIGRASCREGGWNAGL